MKTAAKLRVPLWRLGVIGVAVMIGLWSQQAIAVPSLDLPTDPVHMKVTFDGKGSMWDIYLYDFPPGDYDMSEGTYDGWCVDKHTSIKTNTEYSANLYSTYDPGVPVLPNKGNWNMVNYIINQSLYTARQTQWAIWYFINDLTWQQVETNAPGAGALVDDALANGGSFEPGYCQNIAVLCDARDVQDCIVEVHNPVPEASTMILFGSGLSGLLFLARRKGLLKF